MERIFKYDAAVRGQTLSLIWIIIVPLINVLFCFFRYRVRKAFYTFYVADG